jgi:hypothetical protein
MPGSPVQVFTDNRPAALALAIGGAIGALIAWLAGNSEWTFVGLTFGAIGVYLLLTPIRLELYPDHISYRSGFRSSEMRFDALERFYYCGVSGGRVYGKGSAGVSKTRTQYSFKLVDDQGQSISLGMRLRNPEELGKKLVEYTYAPLMRRCNEALAMGRDLDFGHIRLSRTEGLIVRKPNAMGLGYHNERIPLDQVGQFDFRAGHFYIWRKGEKHTKGPLIRNIPNAFVLMGMLEKLCPSAISGSSAQAR